MRQRATPLRIKVTFPHGKTICHRQVTDTLVETLNAIGASRFSEINLTVGGFPLLSHDVPLPDTFKTRELDAGWRIIVRSDTREKFMQLQAINRQLELGLLIETGQFEDYDEIATVSKTMRERNGILVTFPDGTRIGELKVSATFLKTIEKLGVKELLMKGILTGSKQLITKQKMYSNQIQSGEYWITTPNTHKERIKVLKVAAAMMHTNIDIDEF